MINKTQVKKEKRDRRHKRIRKSIFGTKETPRLAVYKSNRYITAQLIDDEKGITLISAHSKGGKAKTPEARASDVGSQIAEKAKTQKISKVVFDRGGFVFTGKVKALADSARKGGLKF